MAADQRECQADDPHLDNGVLFRFAVDTEPIAFLLEYNGVMGRMPRETQSGKHIIVLALKIVSQSVEIRRFEIHIVIEKENGIQLCPQECPGEAFGGAMMRGFDGGRQDAIAGPATLQEKPRP